MIAGEIEELHTALEQAERARKAAEIELHDVADRISDLSTQNANLSSQKRQLESTATAMQADLDEAISELKNSEERAKKAGKMKTKREKIVRRLQNNFDDFRSERNFYFLKYFEEPNHSVQNRFLAKHDSTEAHKNLTVEKSTISSFAIIYHS
jgi:chromosome segregation ATPase